MCITELKSKSELSQFTESYWMLTANTWGEYTLIPDGTFNVIITTNLFKIQNKQYRAGVYLCPQLSCPMTIKTTGKLFGVRLKAFSYQNVLNTNGLKEIVTNGVIELTNLKCFSIENLSTMQEADSLGDCLGELELFNYQILRKEYTINTDLRDKVNFILDKKGAISVQDLSTEFGISRQALHKSFKMKLGISPKALCDTWRLNNYLNLIAGKDNLTTCAIDAGFYDQAHSINTFKQFWQKNPSGYLSDKSPIITHINDTIYKRFTNYYDPEVNSVF